MGSVATHGSEAGVAYHMLASSACMAVAAVAVAAVPVPDMPSAYRLIQPAIVYDRPSVEK